jgi:ABC-type nitrate/sulfonate/bicarbonate transport system substrate-binding protein
MPTQNQGKEEAMKTGWRYGAALIGMVAMMAGTAARADEKFTVAAPGLPPVFSGLVMIVAEKAGFFKKYGLDGSVRQFDSGVAAMQAVATGEMQAALSPTGSIVNAVSNAGTPIVGIWGMMNPDWVLGSTDDKIAKCADVKGQAIAIDALGGARALAMADLIKPCGLTTNDVKQVAVGSNVAATLVGGQTKLGVLHIDDMALIANQMHHPVTVIDMSKDVTPVTHYNYFLVRKDLLAKNRDLYVHALAAVLDAVKFMNDPKNLDKFAEIAAVTGRTPAEIKDALPRFLAINFWTKEGDGLTKANVETQIKAQVASGAIRAGKTPATYDQLVDESVYKDAVKLLK